MARDDDDEDKVLRSVALQNANAILIARQRAERELLEGKGSSLSRRHRSWLILSQ